MWRAIISNNKHMCVLCLRNSTMETEWKKDILMSTKLCISDKYFRKHYNADLIYWEAYTLSNVHLKNSFHAPSCWYLQRHGVTHGPPAPQYQTFPELTQLYFTGSRVQCPPVSSYLGRQCAPAPLLCLAGFIIRQLRRSLPHFLSWDLNPRGCCLQPSRSPSTGGGWWPGIFRGIMRLNERALITSLPVSSGTPGSH